MERWRLRLLVLTLLLSGARVASAGCIGPVINGVCQGQDVPWDTHMPGETHPEPPPGFHWDWRGTQEQQARPNEVNPFTGHDPNDSHWLQQPHHAAPSVVDILRGSKRVVPHERDDDEDDEDDQDDE